MRTFGTMATLAAGLILAAHSLVRAETADLNQTGGVQTIGQLPAAENLVLHISYASTNSVQIEFTAAANAGYVIEYRDSLADGQWQPLVVVDPIPTVHDVIFSDHGVFASQIRFYRVRGADSGPMLNSNPGASGPHPRWGADPFRASVGIQPDLDGDGLLPTGLILSEMQKTASTGVLTEKAARDLARKFANAQALRYFKCRPFNDRSPAQWTGGPAGYWVWRQRCGYGTMDFEAEVRLDAQGKPSNIEVQLLDIGAAAWDRL